MAVRLSNYKNIKPAAVLPELGFWLLITLLFLYERQYLIQKISLPFFIWCVTVRLALLFALTWINLHVLMPRFFGTKQYYQFGLLLLLSVVLYVAAQSAYDVFLFGFVIGDMHRRNFWFTLPYNVFASAWYIIITISFKLSKSLLMPKPAQAGQLPAEINTENIGAEFIYLKTGTKTVKTRIDAITYIQALKDYSIIYTADEKIIIKGTLKYVEDLLPCFDFLRVHRSYIIAKNKITAVGRNNVNLTNNINIPIGKSYRDKLIGF